VHFYDFPLKKNQKYGTFQQGHGKDSNLETDLSTPCALILEFLLRASYVMQTAKNFFSKVDGIELGYSFMSEVKLHIWKHFKPHSELWVKSSHDDASADSNAYVSLHRLFLYGPMVLILKFYAYFSTLSGSWHQPVTVHGAEGGRRRSA
jgi:hypothetical protein